MEKLRIGIIVSHRDTGAEHCREDILNSLYAILGEIEHNNNEEVRFPKFDYQRRPDLSKIEQTQDSIKESMRTFREDQNCDEVIFMPLIDGEFGEGMQNEYNYIRELNAQWPDDKKYRIYPFANKDRCDEEEIKPIINKDDETLPVLTWYTDDTFRGAVLEKIGPIVSGGLRQKAEEEEKEKGEKKKKKIRALCIFLAILAFTVAVLCKKGYLPVFNSEGNGIEVIDSTKAVLPNPELRKDSTERKDPEGKRGEGGIRGSSNPGGKAGTKQIGASGGAEVVLSPAPIEESYPDEYKLQNKLYYITYEAKDLRSQPISQRWNISGKFDVTEDRAKALWNVSIHASARKHPAGNISGFYFVYVDVFVTIKNTVNGKLVFDGAVQSTGIKGGSPNSFEDAVSKAYVEANKLIVSLIEQKTNE